MATNNKLKAYVRYDGTGRVIAGSLILQRFKPKVGNWKEINAYECCNPVPPGPVSCNNFWINQTFNPDNVDGVYAIGSGMDSQCNSFIVMNDYWTSPNNPNQDSGQNFLLQKFNDAGDLVWNRVFDFGENGTTYTAMDVQTMIVDKEDNIICFVLLFFPSNARRTGIVKFDNDGNQLWSKVLFADLPEDSYSAEVVEKVSFDSSNNIYVSLYVFNGTITYPGIKKISPSGTILASKFIPSVIINEAFITTNSIGELYVVARHFGSPSKYVIIKLDSSLNEIWNKKYIIPTEIGQPSYMYGVELDKDENIIYHIGGFSQSSTNSLWGTFVKMSPNGDIIWTTRINNIINADYSLSTYQLYSDSKGDIYISTTFSTPIPGYSGNIDNTTVIAKISTDGVFQWAYALEGQSPIYNYYLYTPIAGTVKNNSLILGYYDNNDPFNAQLFKLPLTPIDDGVYGDYTITNITDLWTTSSPTLVLSDDTATYADGLNTTDLLTYITFEGNTYTTNHISL